MATAPLPNQAFDKYQPKKWPKQSRSKATFDLILDATADLLRDQGFTDLTTNHIADKAGVSIGSLYEFFANKEVIVAVIAERKLRAAHDRIAEELDIALAKDDSVGIPYWVRIQVDTFSEDAPLLRVLLREIPFLDDIPAIQAVKRDMFGLARIGGRKAHDQGRIALPRLEADVWLIARMVQSAVLDIALSRRPKADKDQLTEELGRLSHRMITGRDDGAVA